jgi:hypothetical protein
MVGGSRHRGLCETPLSLTVRLLPEMLQNGGDTPH